MIVIYTAVEVDARPELNRMMTNIDMNNQNITNAGTIVSDNMTVGRNAVLNGRETSGVFISVRDCRER